MRIKSSRNLLAIYDRQEDQLLKEIEANEKYVQKQKAELEILQEAIKALIKLNPEKK